MTGIHNSTNLYDGEKNPFLKRVTNLVPRIVIYDGTSAFCLVEKDHPKTYYCFFSKRGLGIAHKEIYCLDDAMEKLSLADYFEISYRLRRLKLKINLKKIIYDSNRNK